MSSIIAKAFSLLLIGIFSFPLVLFATFTTVAAFVTLLLRATVIYFDLGLVLLQSAVRPLSIRRRRTNKRTTSPASGLGLTKSHLGSSTFLSTHSPAKTSPNLAQDCSRLRRTSSFASPLNPSTPSTRDYESVGGWRIANGTSSTSAVDAHLDPTSNAGEEPDLHHWTALNARLELPAPSDTGSPTITRQPRRRSSSGRLGSASASASVSASPETMWRRSRSRKRVSGSASPEGYFAPTFSSSSPSAMMVVGSTADVGVSLVESPVSGRGTPGKGSWASLKMAGVS